jgi:hypothetical protein
MNRPPHTTDPLLKSLSDEAAELPGVAASEARRFNARRTRHRRLLTRGLVFTIIALCYWQSVHLFWPAQKENGRVYQTAAPTSTGTAEFVKVRTLEQAMSQPLPTPPGASREQKDLLEAARGLPLVLVLDRSGKLARIHVVEPDPLP